MPKLIGLVGKAGSGKSTVAEFLEEEYRFEGFSFSTPIKDMLDALGVPARNLFTSEGKAEPLSILSGRTARHAMQTLGTEWGRDQMHKDFWTNIMKIKVDYAFLNGFDVVIDDVRFQNEVEFVNSYASSELWLIDRQTPDSPSSAHVSERIDELRMIVDTRLPNNDTLEELYRRVKIALESSHG